MSVYNSLQPLTQVADIPEFMQPSWFRKRNGSSTMFSDIFNVAVPAITTVAGTILGGPVGTALGQAAGNLIVGGVNSIESKRATKDGSKDAKAQIDNDLAPDLAKAGLVSNLAGMLNISGPKEAILATTASVTSPELDPSGLGQGVMDVTGMSGFNQAKNNLVNQFSQPATQSTPWQVRLNAPSADVLPGMMQQAVGATVKKRLPFQVGTSLQTFFDGGKATTRNYKRYLSSDKKSEDLDLIDKKTGKKIGAMRYEERIFDQEATKTLENAVRILNLEPSKDGYAWLGKFIAEETNTHKDFQQNFAEGGKPYDPKKVLSDLRAHNQRLIESWQSLANEPTAYTLNEKKQAIEGAKQQISLAKQTIADIDNGKLTYNPLTKSIIHKDTKVSYRLPKSSAGYDYYGNGFNTQQDRLLPFLNSGSVGAIDFLKPTIKAPLSTNKNNRVISETNIPQKNTTINVLGKTTNPATNKSAQPSVPPKTGITNSQLDRLRKNINTFLPNPDNEAPFPVLSANSQPKFSASADTIKAAFTLDPKQNNSGPSTPPSAPADNKYNWLSTGNIADAARAYVGYRQASRDLPENPINPDYLKVVADAKLAQTEGLGVASRKLYNDQINDARTMGIDSVRRVLGGGGSAGAAVAGLSNVNDATNEAALKLAAANEQANLVKQNRYAGLLGGLVDQEQQRYGQTYNAALLNRQAGINLAGQGLQGIQDRADIWNMYDNPDSPAAKYAALQLENQKESIQAAKRNYTSIGRLLTRTTSNPQ